MDSTLLSPAVMKSGPKPWTAGVASVAEQRRDVPLSELMRYSPACGRKCLSSVIRETAKLSSLFTTSVYVSSPLRHRPAPSDDPPKTKFGDPLSLSSLLSSEYTCTPGITFFTSGGVTE